MIWDFVTWFRADVSYLVGVLSLATFARGAVSEHYSNSRGEGDVSSCVLSAVLGWGYGCFGVFDCVLWIGCLWVIPAASLMWG